MSEKKLLYLGCYTEEQLEAFAESDDVMVRRIAAVAGVGLHKLYNDSDINNRRIARGAVSCETDAKEDVVHATALPNISRQAEGNACYEGCEKCVSCFCNANRKVKPDSVICKLM